MARQWARDPFGRARSTNGLLIAACLLEFVQAAFAFVIGVFVFAFSGGGIDPNQPSGNPLKIVVTVVILAMPALVLLVAGSGCARAAQQAIVGTIVLRLLALLLCLIGLLTSDYAPTGLRLGTGYMVIVLGLAIGGMRMLQRT